MSSGPALNVLEQTLAKVKTESMVSEMTLLIHRILQQLQTGEISQRMALYDAFEGGMELARKIYNQP